MNEREKIKEVVIDTRIYNPELPQKVIQAFSADVPELVPNTRFGLEIVFNKSVYHQAAFYQYQLTEEHKEPAPKTEQERLKQKIYDVLTEQLHKVLSAMKENGYKFGDAAIIGDELDDDTIHIILYRQEVPVTGKGKRQTEIHASSIIPDRPFILQQASEVLAKILLDQMRKETAMEVAKKNYTPNWVSAGDLFVAISDALATEIEGDEELTADKLIDKALMTSDWPLHMRSKSRAEQVDPITSDTRIDCPEYIIFQLNHGGSWELKKVDNLRAAQHAISKQGFRYRQTKSFVVLNDLKKVPYSLFAETDDGLILVSQSEANRHKKLHVSWNNNN